MALYYGKKQNDSEVLNFYYDLNFQHFSPMYYLRKNAGKLSYCESRAPPGRSNIIFSVVMI